MVEAAPTVADDDYKLVNESFPAHGILSSGIGTGAGVVGFNRKAPLLTPPAPAVELTPTDLRNARSVGVFGKGFTGAYMNRLPQMHERLKRLEEQLRPQKSTKAQKSERGSVPRELTIRDLKVPDLLFCVLFVPFCG